MQRVGRWLDRTRSTTSLNAGVDSATEASNMELALQAVELIMNDDIPGAEAQLATGDSTFHKLSRGTIGFMKATLGFESEVMKEATATLNEAETAAYNFHQKAQHDPKAFGSTIYTKGSEFALCQAEAQIMNAVVAVLNENLTESLKGFYKLRKAYLTLDGLAQQESTYMKNRNVTRMGISRQDSSQSLKSVKSVKSVKSFQSGVSAGHTTDPRIAITAAPTIPSALRNAATLGDTKGSDSDGDEFYEADNTHEKRLMAKDYEGQFERPANGALRPALSTTPSQASFQSGATTPVMEPIDANRPALLTADPDSDIFVNSMDIFIHSGVNLMSGMINLMLSVIPPAFGRLLSIIGFRGDRERGLKMLWQASKFPNINGGMAALILFGWYNGIIGFCDIITDSDPTITDDVNGFPAERLENLLVVMRGRYPKSFLWKLEEARSYSNSRKIQDALDILCEPEKAQMKQLEALHQFEKALDAMNAHQYELAAESFLICCTLNEWSQALYYYAVAGAHLQLYRDLKAAGIKNDASREHYAEAEKYFKLAPTAVGKKKMMGRQLPFDTFVTKKIAKWEARSTAWNCTFIDAVGVAPIEEIIMLWNGYKKMNETQLKKSLANMAWSSDPTNNPYWEKEDSNERAIQSVLSAMALRNLRRHSDAKAVLQETLGLDPSVFRGTHKDDWMGATAQYEMAANFWMERQEYTRRYGSTIGGAGFDTEKVLAADIRNDVELVAEARKHIDKAKGWGSYTLDTRLGMKVTAAHAAISKWQVKHPEVV